MPIVPSAAVSPSQRVAQRAEAPSAARNLPTLLDDVTSDWVGHKIADSGTNSRRLVDAPPYQAIQRPLIVHGSPSNNKHPRSNLL
jgi:hypothetical protein